MNAAFDDEKSRKPYNRNMSRETEVYRFWFDRNMLVYKMHAKRWI